MGNQSTLYFKKQWELHPSMQPQDAVKFCYQSFYGAEHLLADLNSAKEYFDKEYASVTVKEDALEEPLYEKISDQYCRMNLTAWKRKKWPSEWLFRMFVATASGNHSAKDIREFSFTESLQEFTDSVLNEIWDEQRLEAWHFYLKEYQKSAMGPVHHSEEYRAKEHPAYRVVNNCFLALLPILEALCCKGKEYSVENSPVAPFVIAIEGRAAAGKSTLAKMLQTVLDGELIQMDDFFLPLSFRTEKRMKMPGGNVHYERFCQEVLPFMKQQNAFSYRRFDCGIMDFRGSVNVRAAANQIPQYRIVEGSYSRHPEFGNYADLTVFCDVDPATQMQRILKRNGTHMAEMFRTRWIPLEENYLDTYPISEKADIRLVLN